MNLFLLKVFFLNFNKILKIKEIIKADNNYAFIKFFKKFKIPETIALFNLYNIKYIKKDYI